MEGAAIVDQAPSDDNKQVKETESNPVTQPSETQKPKPHPPSAKPKKGSLTTKQKYIDIKKAQMLKKKSQAKNVPSSDQFVNSPAEADRRTL